MSIPVPATLPDAVRRIMTQDEKDLLWFADCLAATLEVEGLANRNPRYTQRRMVDMADKACTILVGLQNRGCDVTHVLERLRTNAELVEAFDG